MVSWSWRCFKRFWTWKPVYFWSFRLGRCTYCLSRDWWIFVEILFLSCWWLWVTWKDFPFFGDDGAGDDGVVAWPGITPGTVGPALLVSVGTFWTGRLPLVGLTWLGMLTGFPILFWPGNLEWLGETLPCLVVETGSGVVLLVSSFHVKIDFCHESIWGSSPRYSKLFFF